MWRPTLAQGVSRIARDLTGRSADHLVELLADQLSWTVEGARLAARLTEGSVSSARAHDEMRQVEHAGDAARANLVGELGSVLATPIDAEDIFRLSRSIDDVLDNLRDFVREVHLYRPSSLEFARPLTLAVQEGLECLAPALAELSEPRGAAGEATLAARKAAGTIRRLYQRELASLFERQLDNEVLKRRELLRRLDVVGLRLGEAADALADGALKRNR